MKFIILLPALLLLFSSIGNAQSGDLPTEFQSWNEIRLVVPLAEGKDSHGKKFDKITATFTGNLRIGRKSFDLLDNRVGVSFDFRINRYVSALSGILYREDEITKGRKRFETRLDMGVILSKDWRGFAFRNRQMYEHRFRNSRSDADLYRNRIQISYPIKFKKKEFFSPYVSEEGYFDLKSHQWVQSEFYAGISRKITSMTTVEIAYLHNDTQPYNVDGIHFGLRIKLK